MSSEPYFDDSDNYPEVNDVGRLRGISRPKWGHCRSNGPFVQTCPLEK
jgi:hypothetical protein